MNLSNAMLHTMDSSTPASSSMAIPINQAHHTNTTNNNNTANNNNNNDSTSNDSMCRVISMVQYRQQPVSVGSPMESMFGDKHMRLNSCYVSKVGQLPFIVLKNVHQGIFECHSWTILNRI